MKHSTYLPIDPDFFALFDIEMKKDFVKVIYFDQENYPELKEVQGKATKTTKLQKHGQFMLFENDMSVRLDRIIVYNGKPGPAYDEYDAYALAPLTCKAGYDDDGCSAN